MEFIVHVADVVPDLDTVRVACLAADPTVLVDIDPRDGALRIATQLDAGSIASALADAQLVLEPGQLEQVPSVCCGGCSG